VNALWIADRLCQSYVFHELFTIDSLTGNLSEHPIPTMRLLKLCGSGSMTIKSSFNIVLFLLPL
jgi:hypothetical protein